MKLKQAVLVLEQHHDWPTPQIDTAIEVSLDFLSDIV
jgi:hypothetical protein